MWSGAKPVIWIGLGLIVLVLVGWCRIAESDDFYECFEDSLGYGETLYYGNDAYYDQISRDYAISVAKDCSESPYGPVVPE